MRVRAALAATILATLLAGCSTVRGAQDIPPGLLPQRPLVGYDAALETYYKLEGDERHDGMTRQTYRDYVIGLYLGAVEADYRRFVNRLGSANRGTALGFDLLLLGLSGATALAAPSATEELATVTTVTAGARASIDKNLFYDRTLPAVIAAMDAERAGIKAEIERKRALPPNRYSLDTAFGDLRRLVEAGRLDSAFARITKTAVDDRAVEEARLSTIVAGCDEASEVTPQLNTDFRELVKDKPDRVADAAAELGVTPPTGEALAFKHVRDAYILQVCTDPAKQAFLARLRERITKREGTADGQ